LFLSPCIRIRMLVALQTLECSSAALPATLIIKQPIFYNLIGLEEFISNED
jgi:hypothetical protein